MCLYLHFVLWIGVLVLGWCLCCSLVASLCFQSLTVVENLVYFEVFIIETKSVLFVEVRARPGRVNCSDI